MSTVATRTTVEVLRFHPESARTSELFHALHAAASTADVQIENTARYQGGSDLLMIWGPGSPLRFDAMRRQIAAGGHFVAWDLAYWHRESKLRVSIDAAHPQRWLWRKDWPRDRYLADRVHVSDVWNPFGPIIVAGIGRKARVQYGHDTVTAWETQMMQTAAGRFGRPVLYRRKQVDAPVPSGAVLAPDVPIEHVLAGSSLLITWHSNVAVDAIRMGIPVICQDGAATAVCASRFGPDDPAPLETALRDRFLWNLAWFQWSAHEASACWAWIRQVLA